MTMALHRASEENKKPENKAYVCICFPIADSKASALAVVAVCACVALFILFLS